MKIIFAKERVFPGVQRAISIMPSKSGAAALRALWINAKDDTLTIQSTDANLEFTGSYPAEVQEPGFIGIQGQIFSGLVGTCQGNVELSYTEGDGSVQLTHAAGVCKLPVQSLNWYASMKPFPETPLIDWSGDMVKEIIDRISFCINDDATTLDALSCLYITRNDERIDICGLNGHEFARYTIIHDQMMHNLPEDGVLIQRSYLSHLNKFLNNDEIEVNFTDSSAFFKNSNNEMLTIPRVANIIYPNYKNFLSRLEEFSTLTVEKDAFMHALNRIATVNTDTDSCTDLNIDESNTFIKCSANIENTGEVEEKISITYDGNIRKISFRTKHLLTILDHFVSKTITMRLTSDVGPCSFEGDDDPFYQVVLMPVHTIEKEYVES
ncbi:MAG: DNA polymerase III subunit beta [Desulfovibrio sp.]|nr:DNA polymerase III subunit beta [Desulfovibrio sp.]